MTRIFLNCIRSWQLKQTNRLFLVCERVDDLRRKSRSRVLQRRSSPKQTTRTSPAKSFANVNRLFWSIIFVFFFSPPFTRLERRRKKLVCFLIFPFPPSPSPPTCFYPFPFFLPPPFPSFHLLLSSRFHEPRSDNFSLLSQWSAKF